MVNRLRTSPDPLALARSNLLRWKAQNSGSPALLRCYEEWETLLDEPVERICEILLEDTSEGQRLRQNSPFVGILTATEVWALKKRVRECETPPA